MAEPKLLPCPFCGCKEIYVILLSGHGTAASCERCEAQGPYGHDGDKAVSEWNTRADVREAAE